MYAVIQTGGKQYRVSEGQILTVEKLDVEAGKTVEFSNVLAISDDSGLKIGAPFVSGAKVIANVLGEGRHEKIKVIKFRRRKHYRKQQGHRQYFTKLEIKSIK